jgi:restriction endonuclease Mrr
MVVLKHYIPKNCTGFSINIFKLCDPTGYKCNMKVYLGKDRQHIAQHVRATTQNGITGHKDRRMWSQTVNRQLYFFP